MASNGAANMASLATSQMEEFAALPYSFSTSQKVETCSTIFRLNYGATALLLLAASLTVTMKQFGGRPIECVVDKELNVDVVNNFCWIHATFSSWKFVQNNSETRVLFDPGENSGKSLDHEYIYVLGSRGMNLVKMGDSDVDPLNGNAKMVKYSHGILHSSGPSPGVDTTTEDSLLRYHKYVQWIAGILIFQGGQPVHRGADFGSISCDVDLWLNRELNHLAWIFGADVQRIVISWLKICEHSPPLRLQ